MWCGSIYIYPRAAVFYIYNMFCQHATLVTSTLRSTVYVEMGVYLEELRKVVVRARCYIYPLYWAFSKWPKFRWETHVRWNCAVLCLIYYICVYIETGRFVAMVFSKEKKKNFLIKVCGNCHFGGLRNDKLFFFIIIKNKSNLHFFSSLRIEIF